MRNDANKKRWTGRDKRKTDESIHHYSCHQLRHRCRSVSRRSYSGRNSHCSRSSRILVIIIHVATFVVIVIIVVVVVKIVVCSSSSSSSSSTPQPPSPPPSQNFDQYPEALHTFDFISIRETHCFSVSCVFKVGIFL